MPANLENSAVATGPEKISFNSNPKERQCQRMIKLPYNCFNSTWTMNFQMFKLDLEKAEEPEIKLPTSAGSSKNQKSSRKTSISALLTTPKPLTVWITRNCGKFWKRWEYQTTWPASWENSLHQAMNITFSRRTHLGESEFRNKALPILSILPNLTLWVASPKLGFQVLVTKISFKCYNNKKYWF